MPAIFNFFQVVLTYLYFVFRGYDSILTFRSCAVAPYKDGEERNARVKKSKCFWLGH